MRVLPSYLAAILLYALLVAFGQISTVESVQASLFWPSSGLLLAALWLSPYRYWPALVLTAILIESGVDYFLMEDTHSRWIPASLFANASESTIGAFLLRRWPGRPFRINSLAGLLRTMVCGCLIGTTIGTLLGTLHLVGATNSETSFALTWRINWLAHCLGIVTVTPALLWTWQKWGVEKSNPREKSLEMVVTVALSLALVVYVFSRPEGLAQPFILYPPLVWIAGRFGLLPIAYTCLVTAGISITYTRLGVGPFNLLGSEARADSAAQMFVLALTLSALAIATNLSDRDHSMEKRERAQRELLEAEQQYETLFEQAAVAILVVSPHRIERANPAARKLLRRSEKELEVPLDSLSAPDSESNKRFLETWPDFVRDGLMLPWTALRGDGQTLELELYISRTALESGPKYQVVVRDKTHQFELRKLLEAERQRLEFEVTQATAELEKTYQEFALANEHRERFLATVSHELRTPLSAILGICETLKEGLWGPLTPSQVKSLKRISESGQYLDELVSDLLELAKVQVQSVPVEMDFHSVSQICRDSIRLVSAQAQSHNVDIFLAEVPSVSVVVDCRFCKQILVNLLTNSIKFTPPGGRIVVEAHLLEDKLTFEVCDTGTGIPENLKDRIFEPFVRADESVPGFGLGLALVYKLTQAMGGSVTYESEAGKGTVFTVVIPVGLESSPNRETAKNRPDEAKVIILEQEPDSLNRLGSYLRARSYRVHQTDTLKEFEELVFRENPQLVILECLEEPGIIVDTLERLHKELNLVALPVVLVLVPVLDEELRQRLLSAGATTVLPKLTSLPDLEKIAQVYM